MISKDKYELVKQAIKEHSRLEGRTYLILYKSSVKQKSKAMEISIREESFWHLVGCKIDEQLMLDSEQKHQLYLDCRIGKDVSNSLTYTRQAQDVSKKATTVINIFDFVSFAKAIRICQTEGTPEATIFQVGAGSCTSVIGYSNKGSVMIPITAQQKSIFKVKSDANDKIFLIISKPYQNAAYDRVDYTISRKVFPNIIDEIPETIKYDNNLFCNL